ncbi:uncharacterized protein LOC118186731 isoform X2 [Stegodyphus dumicola]|uniref:uncharacterized protein LOC118186731 isoform X2 n=1 Tax=Stegodyphus dumicola TaxID=202533 RepID=UPI0015AC31A0|nr:uncharacterized protein LOC118186731 isoform X2 [Stegodyphus dumicola]
MRYFLCLILIAVLAKELSSFRLALRVCFKDTVNTAVENDCAYCNPRTLLSTDGIPDQAGQAAWTAQHKRCILRTCREQYPEQKILPTLIPKQAE